MTFFIQFWQTQVLLNLVLLMLWCSQMKTPFNSKKLHYISAYHVHLLYLQLVPGTRYLSYFITNIVYKRFFFLDFVLTYPIKKKKKTLLRTRCLERKLNGESPVDNRPFTNMLNHFYDMWHVTCDTWHMTHDTWNVTCDM